MIMGQGGTMKAIENLIYGLNRLKDINSIMVSLYSLK
jgi:hypothetical protein